MPEWRKFLVPDLKVAALALASEGGYRTDPELKISGSRAKDTCALGIFVWTSKKLYILYNFVTYLKR